jgi:hypothetical protein
MGYYEIVLRYDDGLSDRYMIFAESRDAVKQKVREALRNCQYDYDIESIEKSNIDGIIN